MAFPVTQWLCPRILGADFSVNGYAPEIICKQVGTAQKFQEPETEVLQRRPKLQKFYAHSFVKLMWA